MLPPVLTVPPLLFLSLCGLPLKIEDIVTHIQDETEGVPIRTVKSFMTKIPSVVTGKYCIYNCLFSLPPRRRFLILFRFLSSNDVNPHVSLSLSDNKFFVTSGQKNI